MIHTEFIQGSEEWFNYRLGKVSASRVAGILPGKTGYKASRDNYMAELACEILTGTRQESYCSTEMQRGIDLEETARIEYELTTGNIVSECGFVDHLTIKDFGCSPDGLMEPKGLEIKCPNTANHIQTMKTKQVKYEYNIQMQVGMLCCGMKEWDYVSFDDRMPGWGQLFIMTVKRDEYLCNQIESEVKLFLAELGVYIKDLEKIRSEK